MYFTMKIDNFYCKGLFCFNYEFHTNAQSACLIVISKIKNSQILTASIIRLDPNNN